MSWEPDYVINGVPTPAFHGNYDEYFVALEPAFTIDDSDPFDPAEALVQFLRGGYGGVW